jgi:hypothetical protein
MGRISDSGECAMAGTRAKIRGRRQSGNHARKVVCCALVAATVLGLAVFLSLDRDRVAAGTMGQNEPIDFSSLAGTIVPLDEFGASGNNPAVIASSSLSLSTTSAMKSNFMQSMSVSDLVSRYAGNLQRHLENGLRNAAVPERKIGKPALLTVSLRPTGRLLPEARIVSRETADQAGQ